MKLSEILGDSRSPLIELVKKMRDDELNALISQVTRLSNEEKMEKGNSDEYTIKIIDALSKLHSIKTQ